MSRQSAFAPVARLIDDAVRRRAFPCAVVEVGDGAGPVWRHAAGALSYGGDAAATPDTVFDLASLTKVLATTTVVMRLVEAGALALDEPVAGRIADWRGSDRAAVTVADLLEHAGGLTAHLPFFRDHRGRPDYQHAISTLPLEYPPRRRSVYSDLGFILLAFIAADAGGAGLDEQFDEVAGRLGLGDLRYRPPAAWRRRTAPTEVDPWRGRLLRGEVHDENGWALGGVAGHAGLFGTAPAVGRFARAVLETLRGGPTPARPEAGQGKMDPAGAETLRGRPTPAAPQSRPAGQPPAEAESLEGRPTPARPEARPEEKDPAEAESPRRGAKLARPETLARFVRRSRVAGSSRALGWDTMLVTSSCGRLLSPAAFGHTGFTGTSLWIDPAQDLYVVLLTNRVHPTRANEAILQVRPAVHDAVVRALTGGS